jgi:predicted DNA-binding transcriptional regulator AlpA
MNPPTPPVLTTGQLANRLGVCPSTVLRWVVEHRVPPPIRLRRNCLVWTLESVKDLIAEHEAAPA